MIVAKCSPPLAKEAAAPAETRFVSYAGNHEDVLLHRIFGDRATGFYVDIGAHHPVKGSLTKQLYDRGWRGINVEPIAPLHQEFVADRPRDVNILGGVSSLDADRPFWQVTTDPSLSTFDEAQAREHEAAGHRLAAGTARVWTLAALLREHAPREIDLLSIDVEGHEREVLLGADFTIHRPQVVVIESVKPWSTIGTHAEWEDLLVAADYGLAAFDGVNRWYVGKEAASLARLLSVPVNAVDGYIGHREYLLEQEVARLKARSLSSRLRRALGRCRSIAQRALLGSRTR